MSHCGTNTTLPIFCDKNCGWFDAHAYPCAGLGKICRTLLGLGSCGDDALRLVAWVGQQRRTHRYHVRGLKRKRTRLPCILWLLVVFMFSTTKGNSLLTFWHGQVLLERNGRLTVTMFTCSGGVGESLPYMVPPIQEEVILRYWKYYFGFEKKSTLKWRRLVLYLRL